MSGSHEGWLVRALLGRTAATIHEAGSRGVSEVRVQRYFDAQLYEEAVKALIYLAVATSGVIGILSVPVVVLVMVTDSSETWLDEIALGLGWLGALRGLVCLVRLGILRVARGRPARWAEPWNWDLVWQACVVVGPVLLVRH